MKRILIVTSAIVLMSTITNAQTTFGIKAGVTFQNLTGKDSDGDKFDNNLKTGMTLGVNAEIPIAKDFYLQPGAQFTQKGWKSDEGGTRGTINYIDVPLSLVYKPMLGTGKLILGFGPYVGFGVGGSFEQGGNEKGDIVFQNEVTLAEYTSEKLYFKKMDAGANLFFGYEFSNKFSAQLNTQLGLVQVNPNIEGVSGDESSWKNVGFGATLGYRF